MKQLTYDQVTNGSRAYAASVKRWRLTEIDQSEFIVYAVPETGSGHTSSPDDGETMRFWRFNQRGPANLFRNRKIVNEVMAAVMRDDA